MPAKYPWFERQFLFQFPAEKHPDILERLRGTPVRVEERIKPMAPERLTRRHLDTWSIQENVGHLLDLEPLWAGRVDDIVAGLATMREADLSNTSTHQADHNSVNIDTLTASFRATRGRLVERLDQLPSEQFANACVHPRLKKSMRLVDLCLFVADHDDYHMARITELAKVFNPQRD